VPRAPGLEGRLWWNCEREGGCELTGVTPGTSRDWREELIDDQPNSHVSDPPTDSPSLPPRQVVVYGAFQPPVTV
jgi:hypothetical protein